MTVMTLDIICDRIRTSGPTHDNLVALFDFYATLLGFPEGEGETDKLCVLALMGYEMSSMIGDEDLIRSAVVEVLSRRSTYYKPLKSTHTIKR